MGVMVGRGGNRDGCGENVSVNWCGENQSKMDRRKTSRRCGMMCVEERLLLNYRDCKGEAVGFFPS